jgi:hypothetical protein
MKRNPRRAPWRRRACGLLRVASLLLTGAALCAWLALDALHARADELASDAGARMLAYGREHALQGAHTLMLNGLALRLVAGTSQDPPARVLAALGERCRARDGQLTLQLQERARGKLPPRIASRAFDPVLQLGGEHGGFLGCLDLGAQRVEPSELLARARRFAREADVAELGALRFVWTRREQRATRYVALWSDGPLPLARAFPRSGDAPGTDLADLPRPAGSRRILSAWQVGAAPLLVSYEDRAPVQRALPSYAATLRARGQRVVLGAPQPDGTRWLFARRGDTATAVIASPRAGGSVLTLTRLE